MIAMDNETRWFAQWILRPLGLALMKVGRVFGWKVER